MKFLVFRKQRGQGCDYTIGCGQTLEVINASTKDEAIQKAIRLPINWKEEVLAAIHNGEDAEDYLNDYICNSRLRDVDPEDDGLLMSEFRIYEVSDEIDLIPILQSTLVEVNQLKNELASNQKEAAERAQYEQLKAKYDQEPTLMASAVVPRGTQRKAKLLKKTIKTRDE